MDKLEKPEWEVIKPDDFVYIQKFGMFMVVETEDGQLSLMQDLNLLRVFPKDQVFKVHKNTKVRALKKIVLSLFKEECKVTNTGKFLEGLVERIEEKSEKLEKRR